MQILSLRNIVILWFFHNFAVVIKRSGKQTEPDYTYLYNKTMKVAWTETTAPMRQ